MHISQLWTYPVKSMVGVSVESVNLSPLGIVGDRHWAIRDNERGGIRGAKKIGGLMQFSARPIGDGSEHVVITFPDGTEVLSTAPNVSQLLSASLQHSVTLESLPTDGSLEHFRRGPADSADMMEELRNIFGRDIDEPLPDFSVFPPEVMEFESPPGTYYDCWPLMIMSTSAVRSMQEALPDSVIDVRRFRPSLVVNTGDQTGHPEFSWAGKTARIGDCEIEFQSACPRCVMVTREVGDDLPADRAILRHIVRDLNQNVGVYAKVTKPGTIKTTDQLTFLP